MADDKPVLPLDEDDDIPVVSQGGSTHRLIRGSSVINLDTPIGGGATPSPAPPSASLPVSAPPSPPVTPVSGLDVASILGPAPATPPPPAAPPVAPGETIAGLKIVTKDDLLLNTKAEEKEVAAAAASGTNQQIQRDVAAVDRTWEGMADEAVTAAGLPLNDDLRRRFRTMAVLYFRDLRDELETASKLTMPVTAGGMGLSDADAERVMAGLRERNAAFQKEAAVRQAEEKVKFAAEAAARQEKETAEQATREKKQLDSVYSRVTNKILRHEAPPPKPPRVIPVVAGAPAAPSTPVPSTPANLPVAAPSAPAVSPAARPVFTDVIAPPKLIGPVEELRRLTVADFRHLSKDPREACLKVRDKIDLLADQAFDLKTQGIKAWQESAVNKLYLDILRLSLEGTPVADVIAKREHDGDPTLSKIEFDAIMDINRKLRFG